MERDVLISPVVQWPTYTEFNATAEAERVWPDRGQG